MGLLQGMVADEQLWCAGFCVPISTALRCTRCWASDAAVDDFAQHTNSATPLLTLKYKNKNKSLRGNRLSLTRATKRFPRSTHAIMQWFIMCFFTLDCIQLQRAVFHWAAATTVRRKHENERRFDYFNDPHPPTPTPKPQYTGAWGNPFMTMHSNIPLLIRAKMKLSGHPRWGRVEGASVEEHLTGHPEVNGLVPATVTRETWVHLHQNGVLTRHPSALPTCVHARIERIMSKVLQSPSWVWWIAKNTQALHKSP